MSSESWEAPCGILTNQCQVSLSRLGVANQVRGSNPLSVGTADSPAARTRPFGVKVIVALQLVYAAVLIVGEVDILVLEGWADVSLQTTESHVVTLVVLNALIMITVITAAGLWQLKYWAWVLLMLQIGVSLGLALWAYFTGNPQYATMAISVITVFYLNQANVRRVFSQRNPTGKPI